MIDLIRTAVRGTVVAAVSLSLASCGTINGPATVMTMRGPAITDAEHGPAAAFVTLEAEARAATGPDIHPKSLLMLLSGLSLARASCGEYFKSAGTTQRNTIVLRQVVNAMGALATTLMLIENVDPDSITLVELGQSTANTGLDIWTRNFLFDADNIAAVEDLVRKAEDAYAAEARIRSPLDYHKASDLILDYQALCQPRRIASLVVDAIRAGTLTPADTSSGTTSREAVLDRKGRRDLADIFGVPGELSADQTGALYWLLMSSSTPETRKGQIATLLGPLASVVLDNGEIKASWARRDDVRKALLLLNADTQAQFATTASATQLAEDKKGAAVLAGGGDAGPGDHVPPELSALLTGRVLNDTQKAALEDFLGMQEREALQDPSIPLAAFVMSPVGTSNDGPIVLRVE